MIQIKPSLVILCGGLGLLAAGCTTPRDSTLVTAPPPQAPTAAPAPAQVIVTTQAANPAPAAVGTTSYVVVQTPPAPLPPEAIPARPTTEHVWLLGYWTWKNNRYEWMAGRWTVPPHRDAKWVNPTWTAEAGAYRFYEGYWN